MTGLTCCPCPLSLFLRKEVAQSSSVFLFALSQTPVLVQKKAHRAFMNGCRIFFIPDGLKSPALQCLQKLFLSNIHHFS